MPGGPQHVRSNDRAFRERFIDVALGNILCALGDCPFRCGVVLRLNRTKRRNNITRFREPLSDQALISQSLPSGLRQIHVGVASNLNLRRNSRRNSSMLTVNAT